MSYVYIYPYMHVCIYVFSMVSPYIAWCINIIHVNIRRSIYLSYLISKNDCMLNYPGTCMIMLIFLGCYPVTALCHTILERWMNIPLKMSNNSLRTFCSNYRESWIQIPDSKVIHFKCRRHTQESHHIIHFCHNIFQKPRLDGIWCDEKR